MIHMPMRTVIRKGFIGLAILVVSNIMPLGTLAADPSCTSPPSGPGAHWPTGSDANTYTYQCDPSPNAGKWTNTYYVYDPATGNTSPLYAPDYAYNCTTNKWTKTQWDYSPADGQFYESRIATSAPSSIPTNCPVPVTNPASLSGAASGTSAGTNSSTPGTGTATTATTSSSPSSIANTGPSSSNTNNLTGNNTLNSTTATNALITNNLTGIASSGDALVTGNTAAGDATSGNTQNMQDVINMLQSTSNALGKGSNVITFTKNINGDVNGDLLLDPAMLTSIQGSGPGSNNANNVNLSNNLTINTSTNAAINNNINLAATSGNATVSNNTSGGDAKSGNAQDIANVVNMINSAVTAGKSFIGTININGNLNGDILLPPNFIDRLIADNVPTVTLTGPSSINTSNANVNNNTSVTNSNNLGINNQVNASAGSGNASVSDNTTGGNASSGTAKTTITAFNLTGSKVIGANDLLVFVNVTGKWVGLIVNAPAGATAAELGGGISSSGPNSTNSNNTNVNNTAAIKNNANLAINNNITTAAKSGNATVSGNTKGGNATSGNANNAVNLLNVENSSLDLSGWFGILFINVFGSWNGSFGIDTPAGESVAMSRNSSLPGSFVAAPLISFLPHSSASAGSSSGTSPRHGSNVTFDQFPSSDGSTVSGTPSTASAVLAAATVKGSKPHVATTQTPGHINWLLALSGGSAVIVYILGERFYAIRHSRAKF